MSLAIASALGAAGGIGNDWLGNFFSQHSNQSSQSYSAAVARDLGLMNQYFTYNNMTYSKILQSMLNAEAFGYDKSLMALQNEYQQGLANTSFAYDSALAELSQELNKRSADQDYRRSVNYIRDSLLKYKSALQEAGYNPLLALGSSAASYPGHTNGVSAGSVPSGSSAIANFSSGSAHGVSPSSPSGGSPLGLNATTSSLSSGIQAGLNVARASSEIKSNEAQAQKDSAQAVEALEKAKTETIQRDPSTSKIKSETVNNYSRVLSGILTGIGTAWGASKLGRIFRSVPNLINSGNGARAASELSEGLGSSATSASVGSNIVNTLLPSAAAAIAVGVGRKGMSDAKKAVKEKYDNPDKSHDAGGSWYDKWRRIYFPMTGGF